MDRKYTVIGCVLLAGILLLVIGFFHRDLIFEKSSEFYNVIRDREAMKGFLGSFGLGAPLVFIGLQILQVIFAPFPGEATGFFGGYIFGVAEGFIYSTIGLTAGSFLNFSIGRFLGKHYIRKIIPAKALDRIDKAVRHQGVMVLLFLFIFPGFPKDYLCLFLGITAIPLKVFIVLAAVGRMPGTFLLSIQGAFLYEKMYGLFAVVFVVIACLFGLAYRYREKIYLWADK